MSSRLSLALACALAGATACQRGGRPPATGGERTLADEIAQLTLPPSAASAGTLARLDARAEAGDAAAGWARLHYLIDLFDAARFARDEAALAALAGALGRPVAHGPAATDAVLDALLVETDRVLAAERLSPGATAARTVLGFDREPPAHRDEVFQRMTELDRVVAGGGPLAANARLRRFGFCRVAFDDAARAPRDRAAEVLSFCLYPLYRADPAPYFADDPRLRPPPPRWTDLADDMADELRAVAEAPGRIARVGTPLQAHWRAWVEARALRLPMRRAPAALGVPIVEDAEPYADAPLQALDDGSVTPSGDQVASQLREAGSDRLAVALYGRAAAASLYPIAGAAARAGATTLELVVGRVQRLAAPPGDYWHARLTDGAVQGLGVLPLSLAALAGGPEPSAHELRGLAWDPRRAALGLHLVVERERWRLVSADGPLATIATTAGDPAELLRAALARVREAFPDEDGLYVAIGPRATYAALIAALVAARSDAGGAALFSRMALATDAPAPRSRVLAERVERRARARVELVPDALAQRRAIARRCYQTLLERAPSLSGTIRLELSDGKAAVTAGPPNPGLRACALEALGAAMIDQGIATATATFSR